MVPTKVRALNFFLKKINNYFIIIGTADFMNWASMHARERGAKFWKAFTTGRGNEVGGIPHDTYGMTTRSVHQYVLGVLGKKGLTESE